MPGRPRDPARLRGRRVGASSGVLRPGDRFRHRIPFLAISHDSKLCILRALLVVAPFVFTVACSSRSATQVPVRGYFGGPWDVTLTPVGAEGSAAMASSATTRAITLQQTPGGTLADDERDPERRLSGTVSALSAHLTNAIGEVVDPTIASPSGATFTGTASLADASGAVDAYRIVATLR